MIAAAAVVSSAQAKTFNMTTGESGVSVWRSALGQKEDVRGASTIGIGDTLFAAGDEDVVIRIESNSKIQVKGGTTLVFAGGEGTVEAVLDEGQIFLDRGRPRELALVRIQASGYSFTPTGTAAAVKTTRGGAPTVAVLRGTVQVLSADGETVSVGPGQFGTVNHTGKLVAGDLNDRGKQQLSTWTGVQIAQASSDDDEDSDVVSDAAPAPAPAAAPASQDLADDSDSEDDAVSQLSKLAGDDAGAPTLPLEMREDDSKDKGKSSTEPTPLFSKPDFEISAGMSTVNGDPWTRLALGIDIPIWRFGVFLDLELFIDPQGQVSNKGWDFENNTAEAIYRKIRYIRYGREKDPLFVKFGGLSSVTLGYGIVMDRFTNMLHYPDQKLLGLQVNLNDLTPYGLSMQTLISDFSELNDDGGIVAARLAFRPLKSTGIPLLDRLSVGGTYAIDINTQAPARRWTIGGDDAILMDMYNQFNVTHPDVFDYYKSIYQEHKGLNADVVLDRLFAEDSARRSTSAFSVYGFDMGMPIINMDLLNVTLYAQFASRADSVRGWGIGAPGFAVNIWKLWGNIEYRMVEGRFTPGFFDRYYLDERYSRGLMQEKGQYIDSVSLSGIYGRTGMDVLGLLRFEGSYQYMFVKDRKGVTVRAYEGTVGVGDAIMSRIPKITVAEVYLRNSNIGLSPKYDKDGDIVPGKAPRYDENGRIYSGWEIAGQFDRTPHMYWGYRAGFDIAAGASLIWDYRYGYKIENGRLVPNNHMFLQTALRF